MDYIHIRGMSFYAYHGVLEEENRIGQRFQADVSIATNLQKAGQTDDLTKTINYAEVFDLCRQTIEGEPVQLIETLGETIATQILRQFQPVARGVRVEIVKPNPPIDGIYDAVSIEITRGEYE